MSIETGRKVIGIGPRGEVVIISFADNVVEGSVQTTVRHQVRYGPVTVYDGTDHAAAQRIARGLAGVAEPAPEPERARAK